MRPLTIMGFSESQKELPVIRKNMRNICTAIEIHLIAYLSCHGPPGLSHRNHYDPWAIDHLQKVNKDSIQ
jgi:hypothetical protein